MNQIDQSAWAAALASVTAAQGLSQKRLPIECCGARLRQALQADHRSRAENDRFRQTAAGVAVLLCALACHHEG